MINNQIIPDNNILVYVGEIILSPITSKKWTNFSHQKGE